MPEGNEKIYAHLDEVAAAFDQISATKDIAEANRIATEASAKCKAFKAELMGEMGGEGEEKSPAMGLREKLAAAAGTATAGEGA